MIVANYSVLLIFTIILFCANVYSENITDPSSKLNYTSIANFGRADSRNCVNCATEKPRQNPDANPQTGFLPVVLGLIALKTALIVSVIAWAIIKFVFKKKDDDDQQGYGYSDSSMYGPPSHSMHEDSHGSGWNRMDFSNYGNYHNIARSLRQFSSVGQLTNVVWKALEKYTSATE